MRTRTKVLICILALILLLTVTFFAACDEIPSGNVPQENINQEEPQTDPSNNFTKPSLEDPEEDEDGTNNDDTEVTIMFNETNEVTEYVKIEMESGDTIVIRLLPDYAPITVANFQSLVSQGFYDGIIFHRVISGFMIQGGDPTGTGYHGSGTTIKGEFVANGVANYISHTRGVVSMARSNSYDSASSQFFICHQDAPHLNGSYAAFGYVVEGIETVDKIAAVETDANDKPLVEQKMKKVCFVIPEVSE